MTEEHIHPAPKSFWRKYVFSTDHKVIGLQYLFTGLTFFLFAGLLAMVMRWQLAYPWQKIPIVGSIAPEQYTMIMTMHGTFMLLFFLIPTLVGGFGNYVVPLQIGARDMALPVLNMLSYWVLVPGCILIIVSFFVPGGAASTGWTMYPPVSLAQGGVVTSHIGNILWVISILMVGASSIMGGINFVVTVVKMRAPGMTYSRLPLTCWAYLLVSIIILMGTPVIASALALLLLDQIGLTIFFTPVTAAGGGGQPLLYEHLFWFYSHPVVYLMILPGLGIIADVISVFSRKPAFGYKVSVGAILAIILVGFIVWGHHIYVSGMNPALGTAFSIITALIGVPSGILVFNIIATLWRGSIRLSAAMLSALAVIIIFVTGGLSGLYNALAALNTYVHGTYWVVAHFHFVVGGASVFAVFAGVYYWFPKMFGRKMNEWWGRIHVVLSFIMFYHVFFTMHLLGIGGYPRRIATGMDYVSFQHLQHMQVSMTISALILGAAQILFVINFFYSMFKGPKAEPNPWNATTLEWTTYSPPPYYNYERTPTVHRWAYEYSPPNGNGRDWIAQHEPLEKIA